ncbi:hypothetical protein NQ318_010527 [Aromia moschata]|uniref:DDE-1 domain-containing protein n=1 Tax=Aromia moschata TaxID=1265417 RepID=A0AAV8YG29_9CUCU|nr:hypothetical protein NQ318_010527 [Aromia moschata]
MLLVKKQVGSISSSERGSRGTIITAPFCCSATRKFILLTLIFPRKKRYPRYLNNMSPGTLDLVTDNGWISTDTGYSNLRRRNKKQNKCLLIMDNHSTHRSIQVSDYASKNDVMSY